jgi:hypothetical protein
MLPLDWVLLVLPAFEPPALIELIEPGPCDELPLPLLVPPTAPVLDAVAPPVLLPVDELLPVEPLV